MSASKVDSSKFHLPKGWAKASLGMVVWSSSAKAEPSENRNARYVGLEHIKSGESQLCGSGTASDVRSTKNKFIRGDILYGKLRPYLDKIALPDFHGICSTDILVLRPEEGIERGFIEAVMRADKFIEFATKSSSGINLPRTNFEKIAPFEFGLAPSKEQKRITAKLRGLLDRERKLRQQLDELPKLIGQYRSTVLEAACTGRLVPTEAELARKERRDFEPASVLLESILIKRRAKWEADQLAKMRAAGKEPSDDKWKDKFKAPTAPSTDNLPELPDGWTYASMAQVCEVQGGIQKQPKRRPRSNHYPFLRVANVQRGSLDLVEMHQIELFEGELETYQLQEGDLLIVEGNGSISEIGRMAVWAGQIPHCVHQNHIIRARPSLGFLPQYGTAYWNSPDGKSRVKNVARSTSGLYTLSVGKVESLPVPFPPLAEQARIVEELERQLSTIASVESQLHAALEEASQLRASLFHHAISGEIVSQSPNEEAASVLLAMIVAARKSHREARKTEARKTMKKKTETPAAKRELLEILNDHTEGLTPDQLMAEAGYTSDEVPLFYKALRKVEKEIQEVRPERKVVILKRRRS